jgi:N-acetylmuramoyl-L-alanine amidase CwlA
VIPSPFHSARGTKPVRLVVVHTAEGSRTVESLGSWFQRSTTKASSHAGIDDQRIETYVPYHRAAWTVRSGNAISDNVELCGFAKWSRDEWMHAPPDARADRAVDP